MACLNKGMPFMSHISMSCLGFVIQFLFTLSDLEDSELESMALHETQDAKVFQKFKKRIANDPQQVSYKSKCYPWLMSVIWFNGYVIVYVFFEGFAVL